MVAVSLDRGAHGNRSFHKGTGADRFEALLKTPEGQRIVVIVRGSR